MGENLRKIQFFLYTTLDGPSAQAFTKMLESRWVTRWNRTRPEDVLREMHLCLHLPQYRDTALEKLFAMEDCVKMNMLVQQGLAFQLSLAPIYTLPDDPNEE